MIFACHADLDVACAWHLGTCLFWCPDCASHACVHITAEALRGRRVEMLPPREAPPLRLTAWIPGHRHTATVTWRDAVWDRPAPVFVAEWGARLSVASTYARLVEWGLN